MVRSKTGEEGFGMVIVVSLIILGIGIVLFFPFNEAIAGVISGEGSSVACTISLINGEGTARCPVDKVKIASDKVEINEKKFLQKGSRTTKEMSNEALARLLQNCLTRGGGLNSRAFSRNNWFESEKVCLECYQLVSDIEINGLTDYLVENKPKSTSSKSAYIKTLTKDDSQLEAYLRFGSINKLLPSKYGGLIIPKTQYSIIFLGIKKGSIPKFIDDPASLITPDVLTSIFKNSDNFFVYITESQNIGKVCERAVN